VPHRATAPPEKSIDSAGCDDSSQRFIRSLCRAAAVRVAGAENRTEDGYYCSDTRSHDRASEAGCPNACSSRLRAPSSQHRVVCVMDELDRFVQLVEHEEALRLEIKAARAEADAVLLRLRRGGASLRTIAYRLLKRHGTRSHRASLIRARARITKRAQRARRRGPLSSDSAG